MDFDTRILKDGIRVPVVAFFGTKGGVGKTTIARLFADLMTLATSAPNVLLLDVDVHHRGMTVLMTSQTPVSSKTIHDFIALQDDSEIEAVNMTGLVKNSRSDSGKLYFIPASTPESRQVFEKSAKMEVEHLLRIFHDVIARAVKKYNCSAVVIDCGPIIDPYTAAAATLSDRAFIIGQNEPISFSSLKEYPGRIREFYPQFSATKMKVIINKVRAWERLAARSLQEEIFAAIPFTLDVVDVSEGLSATNELQMMMFDDYIAQLVEQVFKGDHPELIPPRQVLLPPEWGAVFEKASRLDQAPKMRRLYRLRYLAAAGLLLAVVGVIAFSAASAQRERQEHATQAQQLVGSLQSEILHTGGSDSQTAGRLRRALQTAKSAASGSDEELVEAIELARSAGLVEIPRNRRGDTSRENLGISLILAGLLMASVGLYSFFSHKRYLAAITGLRKGGAQWLMAEMKARRSSRKTFDNLLKMAKGY